MKAIFDPEEIALKKFVIRWRGYDTREVEAFLRAVAVDFRRLIGRVAEADVTEADQADADPSDATGDGLARVRAELNQLSSQLDRALGFLGDLESIDSCGPSTPAASNDRGAGPAEPPI